MGEGGTEIGCVTRVVAGMASTRRSANDAAGGRGCFGPTGPSRAAGGGLAHVGAGPASITRPVADRLVQSGTLAAQPTSAGCGRPPVSATHKNTVSGPTGGPPFGTFLIGRPTGTRPPKPDRW